MTASHVRSGDGTVIIDRMGRVSEATIDAVRSVGEREALRLLTDAGDLLLDERAVVTTRKGRLFARDLARQVSQRAPARIELARPTSLPAGRPPAEQSSLRSALTCLDPPVVRTPRGVGQRDAIVRIFDIADVAFEDVSDDRWTAVVFDADALPHDVVPPSIHDLAVLTLTAWRAEGRTTVSRTTLEQSALRRRLLAAFACSGSSGRVTWLPGYRPVEARVQRAEPRSYATTKVALVERVSAVEVLLAQEGSLVTDLAIVATQLAART